MIAAVEHQEICRNGTAKIDRVAELQQTVSASRLGLWLQCRLRFFFRYVEGLRKPPTPSMHAGSTVHAVLQQWNMARWRREPIVLEQFKALFGSQWSELQDGIKINWDGVENSERGTAWRALEHYFLRTPIKSDERPEAVEVGVEADLSRHGLPTLIGFIDLVRAGGRIVDFKLAGKTPDAKQLVHVHEVQLTAYSVLYRDATGQKESALELHHLVRTKSPKLIISSLPPATDGQKARLFRQIASYQNGLVHRDFVPSPGSTALGVNSGTNAESGTGRMAMAECCKNRLTVVGPVKELKAFEHHAEWTSCAKAVHIELLERSSDRHAWQFETNLPPLKFLRDISARWSSLTFLLDYDREDLRIKGLAKAKGGKLRHWRLSY